MSVEFLYDVKIDIEATSNSRILEVIEHEVTSKCVLQAKYDHATSSIDS